MQIQVHSDNHIEGSARLVEWVSGSVADKLDRFDDEVTRVVVHLNDENGVKAGAQDKRCQIEARPKCLQPVSVTHKAASLELAVDGASPGIELSLPLSLVDGGMSLFNPSVPGRGLLIMGVSVWF